MKKDCPFLNMQDPKLYYFGISLLAIYSALIIMIFGDMTFFWKTDRYSDEVDYYINLIRKKVRRVQMDQRRLVSTRDRSEKQLKRSQVCNDVINAIRKAIKCGDQQPIELSNPLDDVSTIHLEQSTWDTFDNAIDL